ncbi:MAG: ABC transporter ATP-binding protein, partial [Bacteroidia bacterium]
MTPELMDAGAKVREDWERRQASGGRAASFGRLVGPEPDFAHGVALYVEDITVSFDGFKALNNLSLAINVGELR